MRAHRELVVTLLLATATLAGLGSCGDGGTEPDPDPRYGHVAGSVLAGGAPVQGATVLLNGGQAVVTDASGAFRYDSLLVGTYALTLQVPEGYELTAGQTAQRSVQVEADQTSTVSWSLAAVDPTLVVIHLTSNFTFSPASVTISVGQTVRWVNDAAINHTITPREGSQTGVWAEQSMATEGETFEHTFTAAGEVYDYFCRPHEALGMTGQITVTQ